MTDISRRSFVRKASGTIAGLGALALQPHSTRGANEKLQIATIGLRNQGFGDTRAMIKTGKADIVALCDVDQRVLEEKANNIESAQDRKPKTHTGFRKVLDDDEVDAVIIATPDHWHGIIAIEAVKAGKDVYIEKPCAHNVHECRMIAKAAQKYNRIVQHGTQQRSSNHFREAKEYVQSGELGKIAMIRTWAILGRGSIGHKPPTDPPDYVDYDMWLGPAPKKPFTENRFHYNWRFMWDYGTGDMGNWGVHWIDIGLWALDLGWPQAVSSSGGMHIYDDDKETPDTQLTLYEYPDLTMMWELRMWSKHTFDGRGTGTAFYGEDQTLIVNRGGWQVYTNDGKEVLAQGRPTNDMLVAHADNFIECVKSRKSPVADIANGHISAAVSILGNVSYLADEKVRYNPERDQLMKEGKNKYLTRTYRDKWPLPTI